MFVLLFASIIFIAIWNKDYLEGIVSNYVEKYGLIGILILSMLADSLDQPIGPEVLASVGFLFGLNIFLVILFSTIGSYIASLVNYHIGKRIFSDYIQKSYSPKKYQKYENIFRRYGGPAVWVAAWTPVPWTLFCWLAGSFHMKMKSFVFWGLIPRFLRIAGIVLLVDVFHTSFFM